LAPKTLPAEIAVEITAVLWAACLMNLRRLIIQSLKKVFFGSDSLQKLHELPIWSKPDLDIGVRHNSATRVDPMIALRYEK
jgi:hypothetical protein